MRSRTKLTREDRDCSFSIRIRVGENGRVVIPARFRAAMGLGPGDELIVSIGDGELRVTTLRARIERAQRRVRRYVKPGVSLLHQLIAERRVERLDGNRAHIERRSRGV